MPALHAAARATPPYPLDTFGGLRTNFSSIIPSDRASVMEACIAGLKSRMGSFPEGRRSEQPILYKNTHSWTITEMSKNTPKILPRYHPTFQNVQKYSKSTPEVLHHFSKCPKVLQKYSQHTPWGCFWCTLGVLLEYSWTF